MRLKPQTRLVSLEKVRYIYVSQTYMTIFFVHLFVCFCFGLTQESSEKSNPFQIAMSVIMGLFCKPPLNTNYTHSVFPGTPLIWILTILPSFYVKQQLVQSNTTGILSCPFSY